MVLDTTGRMPALSGRDGPGAGDAAGVSPGLIGTFVATRDMTDLADGTQMVRTTGHREAGVGGGLYLRDDTIGADFAAAHPLWTFRARWADGSVHGYRLVPNEDGAVLFDAFGAYGDATFDPKTGVATGSDDMPAWLAMDDFLQTCSTRSTNGYYRSLLPVRFGRRCYRFASPMALKHGSYALLGSAASGAQNGGYGTVFVCTGLRGITLENYNTHGGAADSDKAATGAMGSVLSDITLFGANNDTGLNRHGVWDRSGSSRITNLKAMYFADDGIRVGIGDGGGAAKLGLSDNGRYEDIVCSFNGGNGIKCVGGDSNANIFINIVCNSNGLFGVWESSFLGNSWIGGQEDGNGSAVAGRPWDRHGTSSFCAYAGRHYGVVAGRDAAASMTCPGTDETVWYPFGEGAPNAAVPAWMAGMVWKSGGSSLYDNPNAPVAVVGKYKEGGLGLIQNPGGRAIFLNGIAAQSVLGGKGAVYAADGITLFPGGAGTITRADPAHGETETRQGGGGAADGAVSLAMNSIVAPAGFAWSFNFARKAYSLRYGGSDPEMILCAGPSSTMTYGRPHPVRNPAVQIASLFVGVEDKARQIDFAMAAPAVGDHGRGDIVFNLDATAGGFAGWICVAAGTPGTWKTFGAIGD
ncbi:hypothetical protein [Sphingomonas abietis]|uniref:Uncharacterized protein n=1 Tax=Sphingomonas abietis TaxID=3012344 RepID=A0ABY7NSS5_9SPHN|nr:hypothetical protein [Sphingomonas abietis]WBO23698.1 hypothetical protein PBT88_06140 [Sphingomonas abietis]